MDPPADGDELARVVPLRRRDRDHAAAPGARGTLPRERAPFDPEIEPPDSPLGPRPRGVALHSTRSALRLRRARGPRDRTRAVGSRRVSRTMLLTAAGGVGLAAVAALALLGSILTSSPSSPAATFGSLGGPVAAGALEPTTLGLLSTAANPFDVRLDAAAHTGPRDAAPGSSRAAETKPEAVRSHPLPHASVDHHDGSIRGRRLQQTRHVCNEHPRPLRRTREPLKSLTRHRRPWKRRRLNNRRAGLDPLRARHRRPIDQILASWAS